MWYAVDVWSYFQEMDSDVPTSCRFSVQVNELKLMHMIHVNRMLAGTDRCDKHCTNKRKRPATKGAPAPQSTTGTQVDFDFEFIFCET